MPLLVGTDGHQKMSKSLGNQIGVTDPPQEIYGKTMSIPDEAMADYYRLLFGATRRGPASPPRDAKRALAFALVTRLRSEQDAAAAQAHFDQVIVAGGLPDEVPGATFVCEGGNVHLPGVIADAFGMSRSEARRLIDQGGVTLGEQALAAGEHDVACDRGRRRGAARRQAPLSAAGPAT